MAKRKFTGNDFRGYIYLKYYNYRYYRTPSLDPENVMNKEWDRIYSKLKNKAKQQFRINNQKTLDLQQLEDFLNSYFDPVENNSSNEFKITKEIREQMDQAILSYVSEHIGGFFNPADNNLQGYKADIKEKINKISESQQYRNLNVWYNHMVELYKICQQFEHSSNKGLQNLWQRYVQLSKKFNQLIDQDENNHIYEHKGKYKGKTIKREAGAGGITQDTKTFADFKNEYNSFRTGLLSNSGQVSGLVFEAMLASASYAMALLTKGTTERCVDYISRQVVGSNKGYTGVANKATRQFSETEWKDIRENDITVVSNGIVNKIKGEEGGTQGKVDVNFELPTGENLKFSAKNYKLGSHDSIRLVSGTNLLDIASTEPLFMSHYLNITTEHPSESVKELENPTEAASKYEHKVANKTIQSAHAMMKKLVLLRSLAGGLFKYNAQSKTGGYEDQADFIVVNDIAKTTGKQIRLIPVDQLMDKALSQMDAIFIASSNVYTKDGVDIEYIGYPHDLHKYDITGWSLARWYPYFGRPRMARLYQQMHRIKIKTEVSVDLIKSF